MAWDCRFTLMSTVDTGKYDGFLERAADLLQSLLGATPPLGRADAAIGRGGDLEIGPGKGGAPGLRVELSTFLEYLGLQ